MADAAAMLTRLHPLIFVMLFGVGIGFRDDLLPVLSDRKNSKVACALFVCLRHYSVYRRTELESSPSTTPLFLRGRKDMTPGRI